MTRSRQDRDPERPGAPGVVEPESGAQVVRVARIVREALEGYASAVLADEILRRAAASSGQAGMPRTGRELETFVAQHLGPAVEERLGAEAAEALRERLAPLVSAMLRMEVVAAPSTLPAPPSGSEDDAADDDAGRRFAAIVLAGSPQDAGRLAQRVKMPIHRVADVAGFVRVIAGCGGAPAMVVVDCRFQNPLTSAGPRVLEPGTLEGSVIALWGGNALAEREWRRRFPSAVVLRTDVASDVEDLAVLIRLGPE